MLLALFVLLQPSTLFSAPLATHPRLWITQNDLPRLRSWATASNPMYANATSQTLQEAIDTYNTRFYPGGVQNTTWPDEGLTGSGNAIVTESYAEFFAFMSLVDPDSAKRATYATYAYNLIMYAFNQIYSKMNTGDQNWGNTTMAVYDRARWSGEAFPLVVDWIYGKFTAADKAKIQKVFLYWDNQININYRSPIDHGLNGVGDSLPESRDATNNYYTGTFRNLVLHTICLDAADDPALNPAQDPITVWGNSLRSYIPYWQNRWMQQMYRHYGPGGAAEGGAHPEGPYYGIENMGFFRQAILALQTAGYNDQAVSGQYVQICDLPYWDGLINSTYKQMPYSPVLIPSISYLGRIYQIDSYGDNQHFFLTNPIELYGPMGIYDALKGNSGRLNMARWLCRYAAPGGDSALYHNAQGIWPNNYASIAIFYFMLFDPAAAAPTDPRPNLGLSFFAKGMGRMADRTEWSASASMFTFISSFLTVGHQHGYSGMFGFNRKNEWLTKELTQYGADNKAIASEFHNTLSIKNDDISLAELNAEWWAQYINERGGQWIYPGFNNGDPTLVTSMQPTFDYALTDLTNLYNNPHGAQDATHASRSIIWLKPDLIVLYDRATTGKTGRFKRFNLWLPTNPVINGNQATMTSPKGQKLFITSLLSTTQTLTAMPAETGISMIAEAEPMQYKLVIQDPANPANIRFLTVIQAADGGATAASLKAINGAAFAGIEVLNTAILFPVDIAAAFANTSFAVASSVNRYMVTGLVPNATFDTTIVNNGASTTIILKPGTQCRADSGGVLDFGPGSPQASVKPMVQGKNGMRLTGKTDVSIYDIRGRLLQKFAEENMDKGYEEMGRMLEKMPRGVYVYGMKSGGMARMRKVARGN